MSTPSGQTKRGGGSKAKAEQLNSPLVAEFLQQRAARTAAEQAAVVAVFEAWQLLDENNPDAWR